MEIVVPDPDLEMGAVSQKNFFGPSDLGLVETPRAPPLDLPLKCKRTLQIPIINLDLLLFPKGWGRGCRQDLRDRRSKRELQGSFRFLDAKFSILFSKTTIPFSRLKITT